MRSFLAVAVREPALSEAGRVLDRLAAEIPRRECRWVRPEGLHLTLHFFGELDEGRVGDVLAAVAPVGTAAELYGVGRSGRCGAGGRVENPLHLALAEAGEEVQGEVQALAAHPAHLGQRATQAVEKLHALVERGRRDGDGEERPHGCAVGDADALTQGCSADAMSTVSSPWLQYWPMAPRIDCRNQFGRSLTV